MKKIVYLFILLFVVSSCKVIIKVPLATDGIPDVGFHFGDSTWIQKELVTKMETYDFIWLKKKLSRKKYVDSINNINNQALKLFQENKITATRFNTYAESSRVVCQLFYVLTNFFDQMQANSTQQVASNQQAAINNILQKYSSNPLIVRNRARIMTMQTSGINGNDAFEQLAPQIIAILQESLNNIQQ